MSLPHMWVLVWLVFCRGVFWYSWIWSLISCGSISHCQSGIHFYWFVVYFIDQLHSFRVIYFAFKSALCKWQNWLFSIAARMWVGYTRNYVSITPICKKSICPRIYPCRFCEWPRLLKDGRWEIFLRSLSDSHMKLVHSPVKRSQLRNIITALPLLHDLNRDKCSLTSLLLK